MKKIAMRAGRLSFKTNLGRFLPKLSKQSAMILSGAHLGVRPRRYTGGNSFIQRRKSQLPTQKLSSKRASPVSTGQHGLCVTLRFIFCVGLPCMCVMCVRGRICICRLVKASYACMLASELACTVACLLPKQIRPFQIDSHRWFRAPVDLLSSRALALHDCPGTGCSAGNC